MILNIFLFLIIDHSWIMNITWWNVSQYSTRKLALHSSRDSFPIFCSSFRSLRRVESYNNSESWTSSSLSSWRKGSPPSRSSKVSRHKSAEVGILISWDFTFYWDGRSSSDNREQQQVFILKVNTNIAYHKITTKLVAALQHPTAFDIISRGPSYKIWESISGEYSRFENHTT